MPGARRDPSRSKLSSRADAPGPFGKKILSFRTDSWRLTPRTNRPAPSQPQGALFFRAGRLWAAAAPTADWARDNGAPNARLPPAVRVDAAPGGVSYRVGAPVPD